MKKIESRNRIGRNVGITHCVGLFYDSQNVKHRLEDKDETGREYGLLYGLYTVEKAQRKLVKKLGTDRILVESVQQEEFYASMLLEDFISNSNTQITRKEN